MFQLVFVLISLFGGMKLSGGDIPIPRTKPSNVLEYPGRQPEIENPGAVYTAHGNGQ